MTVNLNDIFGRPHWDIAARYHARRIDRINTARDAAEHDPGTPEAWADGCTCDRDGAVVWGCPIHDPED